ncbi:alpha/beta-hydrolase [Bimuria novae-zelandiae CBS 107.79]|uniref:Alpha/beta-hydrolase n=1 Tax=Bimuria novae-zelandiae CBS 107.79 TaxID=1447943 RepID=A0A6A5V8Q8_9PLEO|nr:alpha/beta-hydrolase [Bimuria novae-zelandiae CBS 107.79]
MHHRFWHLILVSITPYAQGIPNPSNCKDVEIPVPVSVPRFNIDVVVEDEWDTAALTSNLTRRDAGNTTSPLPIAGMTPAPTPSNFTVAATLCGSGCTVLILTHGIIESKLYWHPNFKGADRYSFIDATIAAGYSVLSYDRIGVGSSSKVEGLFDAQFQVETAVLGYLTAYARGTMAAKKVALVGHSYGAYLSAGSANHSAVDAVVLTGFSGIFDYFAPFVAGAGLRVAKLQDPKRWRSLDSTYLTSSDLFAETYIASEPFAIGELLSLLASYNGFHGVTAPILVLQGQFDVSACGSNCVDILDEETLRKKVFKTAKSIELFNDLPAGHNLNLHKVAPRAFELLFQFLKGHGI